MYDDLAVKLIAKCSEKGIEFKSISALFGHYFVLGHDAKLAGRKPRLEEMRDAIDYYAAMDSWHLAGLVILGESENYNEAIKSAIEYLRE